MRTHTVISLKYHYSVYSVSSSHFRTLGGCFDKLTLLHTGSIIILSILFHRLISGLWEVVWMRTHTVTHWKYHSSATRPAQREPPCHIQKRDVSFAAINYLKFYV